jgi:hypothetical protein
VRSENYAIVQAWNTTIFRGVREVGERNWMRYVGIPKHSYTEQGDTRLPRVGRVFWPMSTTMESCTIERMPQAASFSAAEREALRTLLGLGIGDVPSVDAAKSWHTYENQRD